MSLISQGALYEQPVRAQYRIESARRARDGCWELNIGDEGPGDDSMEIVVASGALTNKYDPRDHRDLFLELADVEPTAAGVRSFAASRGLLTGGAVVVRGERPAGLGEPLSLWSDHIEQIGKAQHLYADIKTASPEQLETYFSPETLSAHRQMLERNNLGDIWDEHVTEGAVGRLRAIVQEKLDEHCRSRYRLSISTQPEGARHLQGEIEAGPDSLIGVIWLQCAEAFAAGAEFLRCSNCGRAFVAKPRGEKSKRFCSDKCRVHAYRAAKAAA
jgi:hypothetical protein